MNREDHAQHVMSWMVRAEKDMPLTSVLTLFETAWAALWLRAESAVGVVVLESLAELVYASGVEKYPFLAALSLKSPQVSCKPLVEAAPALKDELRDGLSFLLVEFIAVIGDLTDQILTPGLYREISRITKGAVGPDVREEEGPPKGGMITERLEMEKGKATEEDHLAKTGIRNLDEMLAGGVIKGSSVALVGPPGSGKTILAQQIAFHWATPETPVLYFSTLSEPGAKTLFYLNRYGFFDPAKIDESITFVDLGVLVRAKGLPQTLEIMLERLKQTKSKFVVVDSFKVFEDMAKSPDELRKFSYELVINLMTRKCTALFLGEYAKMDYDRNPLFAIIDGLITVTQRELSGEQQRFIQVLKMRGLAHDRNEHTFKLGVDGVEIFAPRLTIKRGEPPEAEKGKAPRFAMGIGKLDDLLGGGIPRGSSLLISGAAGTGKTVLGLELVYRGAEAGEKGILRGDRSPAARHGAGPGLGSGRPHPERPGQDHLHPSARDRGGERPADDPKGDLGHGRRTGRPRFALGLPP